MNPKIKSAVILAAGLGSRLGELKHNKPKAFIRIGEESLIERSIKIILGKGIQKIIIGTGYGSDHFDALSKTYPQVTTLHNSKYASTGSMYTLYLLRDLIKDSFLLMEGDLLYGSDAIDNLIEDERENIILASQATNFGDEVFIECNDQMDLVKMNKNKNELDRVDAELVGICKLSTYALEKMTKFASERYQMNELNIHYEDGLVGIAKEISLFVKVVENLAWCEIDDAAHLQRAVSIVYPKIVTQEGI